MRSMDMVCERCHKSFFGTKILCTSCRHIEWMESPDRLKDAEYCDAVATVDALMKTLSDATSNATDTTDSFSGSGGDFGGGGTSGDW